MTNATVTADSATICQRLLDLDLAAYRLVVYAAIGHEVCLQMLISHLESLKISYLLPRFNAQTAVYELVSIQNLATDTIIGHYNIREPRADADPLPRNEQQSKKLAWLIPAVAFSTDGKRLGRGGGYYDRLLEKTQGLKIGVAYDWQLTDDLPVSAHDIPVDMIVTEQRMLRLNKEK